jgi:hypothetical protein
MQLIDYKELYSEAATQVPRAKLKVSAVGNIILPA